MIRFQTAFLLFLLSMIWVSPLNAQTISSAPVLHNELPIFESDAQYTYAKTGLMQSTLPAWVAFDISSLSPQQKSALLLLWHNEVGSALYDWSIFSNSNVSGLPKNYTIEGNTSAGNASTIPTTGWNTILSVTNNPYHSRQHLVNLSSYNWIRMNVSSMSDNVGGTQVKFSIDLRDASGGLNDDWIFYGDSITQGAMRHGTLDNSLDDTSWDFAQQIHAIDTNHLPIFENGGVGGTASIFGVNNINTWLPMFPGKYVALNYGTNDASSSVSPDTYYTNMETMVKAVIAAGKIPIIPKIPWGSLNFTNGQILNTKLDELYRAYPQIIPGPDFYTFFKNNPTLIADTVHPSIAGYKMMRQMWADFALKKVYNYTPNNVTIPGVDVTNGLIGYWKMDESTWNGTLNEIKDSVGSSNGSAKNGATTALGKFGRAAVLDGVNDYLDLSNNSALANLNSLQKNGYTISYWLNFTGTPTGNSVLYYSLGNKLVGSTGGFTQTLYWSPTDNFYKLWMYMPFSSLTLDTRSVINIQPNSWHFVTFTYTNGIVKKAKLYFDGKEVATYLNQINGIGTPSDDALQPLKIGVGLNGGLYFPGKIDDYRIYNRPLSNTEIIQLSRFDPVTNTTTPKVGDIIQNDKVDLYDYNALLTDFGKKNDSVTKADLDDDNDVDLYDYNILLTNFGR